MLRGGIPIGRVFGIALRLHYSWFIVFLLVTWALAFNYFPSNYPTWNITTRLVAGFSVSILIFASVMGHELMHSVVAQALGIPVKSITLFILGGVAQITKEPEKPRDELFIAMAGPTTSLIFGGIFLGIMVLSRDSSDVISAVAFWLGVNNVALAIFNLIPGFPLDGGRVLRALLWWQKKDPRRATRIASNAGRGVGYIFIFIGILFVFQGVWQGLWWALIGWFMENAAAGSYRQAALQDILQGHTASEVLTRECLTIPPGITVQQLVNEQILTTGHRCFPISSDGRALGLVTLHDVREIPRDQWGTKRVSEVMTPLGKMKAVSPQEDLVKVMQILTEEDIDQVTVVENGQVVGTIGRDSLLAFVKLRTDLGM